MHKRSQHLKLTMSKTTHFYHQAYYSPAFSISININIYLHAQAKKLGTILISSFPYFQYPVHQQTFIIYTLKTCLTIAIASNVVSRLPVFSSVRVYSPHSNQSDIFKTQITLHLSSAEYPPIISYHTSNNPNPCLGLDNLTHITDHPPPHSYFSHTGLCEYFPFPLPGILFFRSSHCSYNSVLFKCHLLREALLNNSI